MPGPYVLVADADPFSLNLLEEACTTAGYEVLTALDGRQALELLARHPTMLVLLDAGLPEMSGQQVAEILKNEAELKVIPVLLAVGTGEKVAPADGTISKPYRVAEIQSRIRETLLTARDARRRARESVAPGGLGDRAQLLLSLEYEVTRACRFGQPLAVVVLRGGPSEELGPRLRGLLRVMDAVFVSTEDEVVAILPDTEAVGAQTALDRVLGDLAQPSLSAGVSLAPTEATAPAPLLDLARTRATA